MYYIICLDKLVIKGCLISSAVLYTLIIRKKVIEISELVTKKLFNLRLVFIFLHVTKEINTFILIPFSFKSNIIIIEDVKPVKHKKIVAKKGKRT